MMNKDEILFKARVENKGADIVALEAEAKAKGVAGAAAMIIGALLNMIAVIKYDRETPGFYAVFFGYWAVFGISKFILLRKRGAGNQSWTWIAYGIIMAVMTVLAVMKTIALWKAGA